MGNIGFSPSLLINRGLVTMKGLEKIGLSPLLLIIVDWGQLKDGKHRSLSLSDDK